ncbi:DUF4232 domain-containing protein [Streptomyces klenkii]|uniref:DUF4232 domain-containing protein n=1 Tax=Streptomyces klenkii TaxID=1420899 RepID=A0A3B0BZQ4_9ACTN|nr:DUF4232 domain-containing protein [Streptomyces klenkii]RKN77634.1 DUF4232 domain-containing protein [Streptomyces klenkii]
MRTSRIRTITAAAAAATATLALTLTLTAAGGSTAATGGNGGTDGATPRAMVHRTAPPHGGSPTVKPTSKTTSKPDFSTRFHALKAITGKAAAADVRACDGQEMSYSVLHRFPKQNGEHLLITAKNTDSKPCWVTSYPSVMLGDSVNVLPHSDKDAPGGNTRITVQPGGKVYSAVALFSGNVNTHTSEEFSVAMRDQTGDTGPAVEQTSFGSDGTPSKFTWTEASVLNWNTAKPYDF